MVRVLCIVSYDGTNYCGFQSQINRRTIQGEIEKTLQIIHKREVKIFGSGRTDALVHAYGQTFHFDTELELTNTSWQKAMNSLLPNDIYIKEVMFVDSEFHARYHVVKKEYRYYLNSQEYDLFNKSHIYQYNKSLDLLKMQGAAELFVGTHDFFLFCSNSSEEKESFVRTIYSLQIIEENGRIEFRVVGNGFLRYMVRAIVGTLIEIGAERISQEMIVEYLAKNRKERIPYSAPPEGLYLYAVSY